MPRERESELRIFEGKALQMHSSCVKKMPATRQKEVSEFDILSDLKDLSDKADQQAEKKLSDDPGLEEWFAAIRKTMENIRDCKNVKDVEYPPSILTFIGSTDKNEKELSSAPEASPVLNMTASVAKEVTSADKMVALSTSKMMTPTSKIVISNNKFATSTTQMTTPSASVRKKPNPFILLHQLANQELNSRSNEKYPKNSSKLLLATPVLNRTFEKINTTVILDSGSGTNINQTLNSNSCNDSGIITRSGSKRRKENECPGSHGILTRSCSKRKSSVSKNKSNKKQKVDSQNIPSATLNKTAKLRHPLRDLKTSLLAAENKKLSAVIKPPVLQKQPVVSKEQQILEEIKKKEKKMEENMQRIKAERQQKAEQTKKNREEKRTKTLQKRLQMEKEKEEKREVEAKKPQVKINKENPKKTTRTKELVEQHVKESKSSIISSTQNTNQVDSLVKTPANRKSDDIESYELTPVPDSSTYNFSDDDDDDKSSTKRIPLWAQGVHLKSELMQQYYNPIDTDQLFGNDIETPNLAEIFKINKKRYFKRTSSAIWNSTPDRIYDF